MLALRGFEGAAGTGPSLRIEVDLVRLKPVARANVSGMASILGTEVVAELIINENEYSLTAVLERDLFGVTDLQGSLQVLGVPGQQGLLDANYSVTGQLALDDLSVPDWVTTT